MIIGIEGPAGAGKTTMARTIAAEVGAPVIEGGVWYRALTYLAARHDITPDQTELLLEVASGMGVRFEPTDDGRSKIFINNQDVTSDLYDESVSASIAPYAQNLTVRKLIEPLITSEVRAHDPVIVVGRYLKRALPEAQVLRVTIDQKEAERRHSLRSRDPGTSVTGRNVLDNKTAVMLGVTEEGVTTVDVTCMNEAEQADVLRQFIMQTQST